MDPVITNIILGALGNALYDVVVRGAKSLGRPSKLDKLLHKLHWERLYDQAGLGDLVETYREEGSQHALMELGQALGEALEKDESLARDVQAILTSQEELRDILEIGFVGLRKDHDEIIRQIQQIIPYAKPTPGRTEVWVILSDLAEQLRQIYTPRPPVLPPLVKPALGRLSNVPELPAHFLPRPDELERLKNVLLADVTRAVGVTGATRRIGVCGMGGIGKSVLAAAVARDEGVRRAFPHGVVWLTISQRPAVTALQRQLASALGDDPDPFEKEQQGRARLSELLADRECLIILDDVWEVEHAEAFNVIGTKCRMLLTTRDAEIVESLEAAEYRLGLLDDDEAMMLLAEYAGQRVEELPDESREVVRECGNLPLALAMIGSMVRRKPDRWDNALHKLRTADLGKIRRGFPDYEHPNLLRAIKVSVEALEPDVRPRYLDFAVFPEDTPVPEAVLRTFWEQEGLDQYDTQDVVDTLVNRSLARRDDRGRMSLHDLQFDYVRKQIDDLPALHNRLLTAYAARCPNGWHTGPDDGYFLQHLAYHLVQARREEELKKLLLDFDWLQAKLEAADVNALVADYDLLFTPIPAFPRQGLVRVDFLDLCTFGKSCVGFRLM